MTELTTPETATEAQIDAFAESVRKETRARARDMLAAGASEAEVAEIVTSLETAPADAVSADEGER